MRCLIFLALVTLAALSALNWRAQLQTQQKLDALAAALAERPVVPAPQPPATIPTPAPVPDSNPVPREPSKVRLPPYVIESPDVLTIEATVKDPKTGKSDTFLEQSVSGQHLVRPDGTVSLGRWGSVGVSGLTVEQATTAIGKHLAKFNEKVPADSIVVTVDVVSYNSKVYYVITDGEAGEQVMRVPLTGNETVLDAVANVGGLPGGTGKRSMWVARATPNAGRLRQTLPVDWAAITQLGDTTTNYQLVPGDRVYVKRAAD